MSKVKVIKHSSEEIELDLEYPVYLYFQDTDCMREEHIKVEEKYAIIVSHDLFTSSVKKDYHYHIRDTDITHHLGEKKWFDEFLEDTLNIMK